MLDRSTDRAVTVVYETRPLTATEGEDYVPASGTIIAPGETSATISVEIIIDEYIEEDEQFRIVLVESQNGLFLDGIQQAIGTIRNDDTAIQVRQKDTFLPTATPARPSCGQTNSKAMRRSQLDLRFGRTWLGQPRTSTLHLEQRKFLRPRRQPDDRCERARSHVYLCPHEVH